MKVLILGPYAEPLMQAVQAHGDTAIPFNGPQWMWPQADFVVSFGYRTIIKPPIPERIINIHTGFLPWNKGAHPNFWAWHDGTKHGVTIHQIDEGIDAGPILARFEAVPKSFHPATTLRSSWLFLYHAACTMFFKTWGGIRTGSIEPRPMEHNYGSSHKSADLPEWCNWDMLVSDVAEKGKQRAAG